MSVTQKPISRVIMSSYHYTRHESLFESNMGPYRLPEAPHRAPEPVVTRPLPPSVISQQRDVCVRVWS